MPLCRPPRLGTNDISFPSATNHRLSTGSLWAVKATWEAVRNVRLWGGQSKIPLLFWIKATWGFLLNGSLCSQVHSFIHLHQPAQCLPKLSGWSGWQIWLCLECAIHIGAAWTWWEIIHAASAVFPHLIKWEWKTWPDLILGLYSTFWTGLMVKPSLYNCRSVSGARSRLQGILCLFSKLQFP